MKCIYTVKDLNFDDMVRRDAFIWEIIRESTLLRDEIAEIEKIDDTDELVEGLLKFYRGFDEVVEELRQVV